MAWRRACTGLLQRLLAMTTLVATSELPAREPLAAPVGVAILHAAPWSPGDAVREGAGEFEVLLRVAQLQRSHRVAGLISVGDRHGMRPSGGEQALTRAALTGVAVVKLARGGEVAATPDELFLCGRALSEDQVKTLLEHCLKTFGAPPAVADPEKPTRQELAKIRAHLNRFRAVLNVASAPPLAAN